MKRILSSIFILLFSFTPSLIYSESYIYRTEKNNLLPIRSKISLNEKKQSSKSDEQIPLQLSIKILGQIKEPNGTISKVIVQEDSILKSHDNFKVSFETNKDAHIYVLISDNSEVMKRLFPDPKITLENLVEGGKEYSIPPGKKWFWLDENIGLETIHVIASVGPLKKLQDLETQSRNVPIEEILKDTDAVVRSISFRHVDHRVFKDIPTKGKEESLSDSDKTLIRSSDSAIGNALSKGAISEKEVSKQLQDLKRIKFLEDTRGVGGIRVYKEASPSVVLIYTKEGIGSGSVIDKDAHILTNWHVVKDNPQALVFFKPEKDIEIKKGDAFNARVVKVDEEADLALLKIIYPPPKITTIKLGNIKTVEVGMDVHAIGHPSGEIWTYTVGIVSQIRSKYEWSYHPGVTHKSKVIQTQTPINPGNSGGPLLNDNAELIGINSFVKRGEGLNFAVSVDVINEFLKGEGKRLTKKQYTEDYFKNAKIYKYDSNKDGVIDILGIDVNRNGKIEVFVYNKDQDEYIDFMKIDEDENGKFETLIYDTDKNGKPDTYAFDNDEDGKPDLYGYDFDEDGVIDRYEEV